MSPRVTRLPAETITDAAGLVAVTLALLDAVRPSLLLLGTIPAGGDIPGHYQGFLWFHEHLLPEGRLHGWYPSAGLGHPLLLYYFPLPFLAMSALATFLGPPAAFKVGSVLGVFALPLCAYASFRLMRFRFPGPLLAAAATLVFLFDAQNPIWGATLPSTLTGEFAHSYGAAGAVLFLGLVYRGYSSGAGPWLPSLGLAIVALGHGYAVLWAGLSGLFFLYASRRPGWTLTWLLGLAMAAACFAGFWLLPLLWDWGWTSSYSEAWIEVGWRQVFPSTLIPPFAIAFLGLGHALIGWRRTGGADHRLLFLAHAAAVAAALAAAGPALNVIGARFLPFAQLAGCLIAAASLGTALQGRARPRLAGAGLVFLALAYAGATSDTARRWAEYDFSGLEAKEGWPALKKLAEAMRGGLGDPPVAVEYSDHHERGGSMRVHDVLPLLSGRSVLDGVYSQSSLHAEASSYLLSELGERSPNPYRSREYSVFDPEAAFSHLRILGVGYVVASSEALVTALGKREDVTERASAPPYTLFELKGTGGFVEPLSHEPVRSGRKGWRDKAYRWFTRYPPSPAVLVFSDDPRFAKVDAEAWLAPAEVPLPAGVRTTATVEPERITLTTDRPGHPLLVRASYHPRWRAIGADGPYLVSPAMMMVIPKEPTVTLVYEANLADGVGWLLPLLALGAWFAWSRRRPPAPVVSYPDAPFGRRWGGAVALGVLVLLPLSRLAAPSSRSADLAHALYERGSEAYGTERFDDAAEYFRHALGQTLDPAFRAELACLRGESLLLAGRPQRAALAFGQSLRERPDGPYVAQALFGLATAQEKAGDPARAEVAIRRLRTDFPDNPWTRGLPGEPDGPIEP